MIDRGTAFFAALALGVVLLVALGVPATRRLREGFEGGDATWEVYAAYEEVLRRTPDEAELRAAARARETPEELRARLRATDEFTQAVRLQDNSPSAVTALHARDQDVIRRGREVYRAARGEDAPRDMDYVLRDLYLELQSWEAVATVLVSDWYPRFEEEARREIPDGLDRPKMMRLLGAVQEDAERTAVGRERLEAAGKLDGESEPEEEVPEDPDPEMGSVTIGRGELEALIAETVEKSLAQGCPTDARPRLYPERWDHTVSEIPDPARDLKLRPEYEWTIPHVPPPMCQQLTDPDTGLGPSPI